MGFSPFGKRSFVGIDIGHHFIKVAQIEKSAGGFKVSKYGEVATPTDAVKESVIIDAPAVGAAIRQALRENDIKANTAIVAVSGGSVIVRPVRIPKMSEATLRKSIKFEAGRYVPSSVEDSFVEFEIIGEVDDTQMDVLIVAAPRDVVESRVKACEAAGLEVDCVDVEPFAAYRALVESDPTSQWHDKTIALIDIGGSSTSMSVVTQGVFAMARSLPQGGQTLTDALKAYFRLSEEDAESGKAQLDLAELVDDATPRENPPLRVVQPHIDDLIREVRRSLNYFQSGGGENAPKSKAVEAIVLSGGGARLPGIADYLGHKLGIPAVSLGLYDNPTFASSATEPSKGLELGVVTGLALRPYTKAA
jgi:type IV pilus assembly protein PilM